MSSQVPIKWMALESILRRRFTHQSDVWSYGAWRNGVGLGKTQVHLSVGMCWGRQGLPMPTSQEPGEDWVGLTLDITVPLPP